MSVSKQIGWKMFIMCMVLVHVFSIVYADDEWWTSSCMIDWTDEPSQCCVSNWLDGGEKYPYNNSDDKNSMGCVWYAVTNVFSDEFDSSVITSEDVKKAAIQKYCNAVLSSKTMKWRIYYSTPMIDNDSKRDWQKTFDSHQSLFAYTLCESFLLWDENPFIPSTYNKLKTSISWALTGDIVKTLKLQQKSKWKNLCSLEMGWLSDCDISIYATEIFSAVMSDMFKIAYAQTLHVNTIEDFENTKDKRIADFFTWWLRFGQSDAKIQELQANFPQTINIVDNNQQVYKKMLNWVKILDNDKLAKIAEDSWCPDTWDIVWIDFIACALHKSQWKSSASTPAFLTLFYNEILNYRIFLAYYQEVLDAKVNNLLLKDPDSLQIPVLQLEKSTIQSRSNMQLKAAENTLKDFEEFNMTYPLHIGLLLYQEQLQSFRRDLSPLVTVFYSLSEKLQNVQDVNS